MGNFHFNALYFLYMYLVHWLRSARFTGVLVAKWLRAAEETGMGSKEVVRSKPGPRRSWGTFRDPVRGLFVPDSRFLLKWTLNNFLRPMKLQFFF